MLALRSGRTPLVNPAAFSFACRLAVDDHVALRGQDGACAARSSRGIPRRRRFASGRCCAARSRSSTRSRSRSQVRALLGGPALYLGMAGYTLKNAPFVAGYVLDLARIPREWLPYNRVVLRLRPTDAELIEVTEFPEAQAARVPGVPGGGQPPARRVSRAATRAGSKEPGRSSSPRSGRSTTARCWSRPR